MYSPQRIKKWDIEKCIWHLRGKYSKQTRRWLVYMYFQWYHRNKESFDCPNQQILYDLNISRRKHFDIVALLKKDGILSAEKSTTFPSHPMYHFLKEPDELLPQVHFCTCINQEARPDNNLQDAQVHFRASEESETPEELPQVQFSPQVQFWDTYNISNRDSSRYSSSVLFSKENNAALRRRVIPKNNLQGIERVFKYWNEKGYPLKKHKRGTKKFDSIVTALQKMLEGFRCREIERRIDIYYKILSKSFRLKRLYEHRKEALGVRVDLDDFIDATKFMRSAKHHPEISWFDECGKPFEELSREYLSADPSFVPYIQELWTTELRRNPADEYELTDISEKLSVFWNENKIRLRFGKTETGQKKQLTRYLFEAVDDNNRDITLTTLLFGIIGRDKFLKQYLERRYFMHPVRPKPKRTRKLRRINRPCEEELLDLDEHLEQLKNRSLQG